MTRLLTSLATLLAFGTAPGFAQQVESFYTDLKLDQCTVLEADDFGVSWVCPGFRGVPVYVAEGDLRFYVSFGLGADTEPAATQTPPPFNTIGEKLEWRVANVGGTLQPIATILRYAVSNAEGDGNSDLLVVTQIVSGSTCHIAYVDAALNVDANELARQAADELAGSFDCDEEPRRYGDFAAWD
ncbi:MAG: hypothetical protein JWR75_1571 [Devosia sp.]|nr:hypothetical protein [Devosia sp.]